MDVIGKRFEHGEAFLPELMLAGEMMTAISAIVKPRLVEESTVEKLGKVVFGTVEGDIHDIGKDIVVFMLDLNGSEVTDLSVDMPPAKFVEAVKETGAKAAGRSMSKSVTMPVRMPMAVMPWPPLHRRKNGH